MGREPLLDALQAGAPKRVAPHAMRALRDEYVRLAVKTFGISAIRAGAKNSKLRRSLEQAHLQYIPEAFTALVWMNTLVSVLAAYLVVALGLTLANALGRGVSLAVLVVVLLLPLFVGASTYVAQAVYPEYRAVERKRLIERELPYAANYISAMASAGVVPGALFRDLAREKTYGEVSREIAWMVRDMDLLGFDLLAGLQRAIARSPSRRFQEFLQGAKTTILSGGDLRVYFPAKAEQYMGENKRTQKEFLDGLGILAESYVTVVIAGPLFMLVMLSIMLLVGGSTDTSESFLFLMIFLMLPLSHIGFAWLITSASPEA